METKERTGWEIIFVNGINKSETRKISHKVRASVVKCRGVILSCNEAGKQNNNYAMGDVSLFVNNKQSHPLHYTAHSKPISDDDGKPDTLNLETCLDGGTLIQGFYTDLGCSSKYPYNLKIYLKCILNNG